MGSAVDGPMILVAVGVLVGLSAIVLVVIVIFSHGYRVGHLTAERDIARAEVKDLRKRFGAD